MNTTVKIPPVISNIANETAPINQQQPAKKYEFIDDCEYIDGHFLTRIRALRDFDDVKKGDLGGYIESENNLSHDGNCWVYNDALVFKNGHVYENAHIHGIAVIRENVGGSTKIKTYTERLSPYGELEIVWV